MASDVESLLVGLLSDGDAAAHQADLAQAVVLRNQQLMLRQRAGAAAARLRRAVEDGAPPDQIRTIEAEVARRHARLDATTQIADTADIRRPTPVADTAQIFGRATGSPEKPPVTAALLSTDGEVIARALANDDGVFHLSADGALDRAVLQLSDKSRRILYRSTQPVSVAAGSILQIEVALGEPEPAPGTVPDELLMPDLVGQDEHVALVLLERLGHKPRIKEEPGAGDPGIVIDQTPEPGSEVTQATRMTLTIRRPLPKKTTAARKTPTKRPAAKSA